MTHEEARRRISQSLDEALPEEDAALLGQHLARCRACEAYLRRLEELRDRLRRHAEDPPDVAPLVLAAIGTRRRTPLWLPAAAVFLTGLLVGALLVGPALVAPPPIVAGSLPERLLEAQVELASLSARLEVTERGWHPEVPVRTYRGTLHYRSPESLALRLDDTTSYPSGAWRPNDVSLVAREGTWWASGPAPCPSEAQPGCTPPSPRTLAVSGREPFPNRSAIPLELVLPVESLRIGEPPSLGSREIAGRPAIGVRVTAAHVQPIVDGLRQAGNWREVHATDLVDLWLERDALVPLSLTVFPSDGPERAAWAAANAYSDPAGRPILEVSVVEVDLATTVPAGAFPPPPDGAAVRDAGFRDRPFALVEGPVPGELPPGLRPHRAGVAAVGGPEVSVRTWTDGRAWLKVRSTTEWAGGRIFGDLGPAVRAVTLPGGGTAYVGAGRAALHADGLDVEISGTLGVDVLLEVAESLGVTGRPAPEDWAEAATLTPAEARLLVPGALIPTAVEGLSQPVIRRAGPSVIIVYTGGGSRSVTVTETPGSALTPPLDAEVMGVAVRGTAGRYTPARGELEWVEDGVVVSLQSESMSLAELVAIAESMEPL